MVQEKEVINMLDICTNKKSINDIEEDDSRRSWIYAIKSFILILVVLFGLCSIMATGGGSDSGSSSSTTSGTVSGSGK